MELRRFCDTLVFNIFLHSSTVFAADKILLCFYKSDWLDTYGFTMDDIDPNLCTHMAFPYISIANKEKGIDISTETLDPIKKNSALNGLKTINPSLKTMIFIREQTAAFSWELSDGIDEFVKEIVAFLKLYKFDGVIFYYFAETAGFRNAVLALKKAFKQDGFLIGAIGNPEKTIKNEGNYVSNLSRDLDFVMLESLNFYESDMNPQWAAFHSPLYNLPGENTKFYQESYTLYLQRRQNATVDSFVSYWINNGYPPAKLIVGISLSGSSWRLKSNETNPPAPAKGQSPARNFTKTRGKMSYSEVCKAVKTEGWQVFQGPIVNNQSIGSYAISPAGSSERIWVSYENQDSAVSKSKYIISKGLGGAYVSSLLFDDFGNQCGAGHNPVTTAIRTTLVGPYQRVDFRKPSVIGRVESNAENMKICTICNIAIYVWLFGFSMIFPFMY